ncbi:MAG: hypothetical protein JRD89_09365, partial [Deltaproteobacteria bacterium]|nr:hypothetical protein [Deltaproteobacteria bacterium]
MRLFGWHLWKSGPHLVEYWREVEPGARILARRWETPEEYHSRPKDMLTVTLLGRTFTIRMPYEI